MNQAQRQFLLNSIEARFKSDALCSMSLTASSKLFITDTK